MSSPNTPPRTPAECFPVGDYLLEEMQARGWSSADLAARMGKDEKERSIYEIEIDVIVYLSHRDDLAFGPETARALGEAFDVSPEYWLNLQSAYKACRAAHAVHAAPESEQ